MRWSARVVIGLVLLATALAAVAARADSVRADYRCYNNICAETWQNNNNTGCYGTSPCFWGTWSGTYARWGTPYILYMEIYGSQYICTAICQWELKSTYPKVLDSGGLTLSFSSGWNYYPFRMNRGWTYHLELSTNSAGGNTSDGFCPFDAQLCE